MRTLDSANTLLAERFLNKRLSRNKKKKLLKYGRLTNLDETILSQYPPHLRKQIIKLSVEHGLSVQDFLQSEEQNRENRELVVNRQLASRDPDKPLQKNSSGNAIENLFVKLF
ncbi:MAG: hypothetical protein JRJ03_08810 [Deltaproteobacteria bacterium]|nr:hypothetical protein [Deltaproteobacteria bacterium]